MPILLTTTPMALTWIKALIRLVSNFMLLKFIGSFSNDAGIAFLLLKFRFGGWFETG
jgi:hypothetical protein